MTFLDPVPHHADHDRLLIAALAAGDLEPAERARAERLVAACSECAALAGDLRAIARATTAEALPVPARGRAFTLRPQDAERLRPGGWRAILRQLGSPRWSFTRPLAAGLTTLGLAGLLVAALPAALPLAATPAGAPAPSAEALLAPSGGVERDTASEYAPDGQTDPPPASAAPMAPAVPPAASPSVGITSGSGGSDPGQAESPDPDRPTTPAEGPTTGRADELDQSASGDGAAEAAVARDGFSMLAIVAGTLVIVGLGLFALRWAAGRLA
jgi:hypothetical protein